MLKLRQPPEKIEKLNSGDFKAVMQSSSLRVYMKEGFDFLWIKRGRTPRIGGIRISDTSQLMIKVTVRHHRKVKES